MSTDESGTKLASGLFISFSSKNPTAMVSIDFAVDKTCVNGFIGACLFVVIEVVDNVDVVADVVVVEVLVVVDVVVDFVVDVDVVVVDVVVDVVVVDVVVVVELVVDVVVDVDVIGDSVVYISLEVTDSF